MRSTTSQQLNRTGLSNAPKLARELIQATRSTRPSSEGNEESIASVRIAYSQDGEPVGSIPPPDPEGAPSKVLTGAPIFLDKLGERLAFERSGVRLYDALLSKFDAFGTWKDGPARADLEEIRRDEFTHFTMLRQALVSLGADPTAVTPSADVHGVASQGLVAVLADPRTNLSQSLEAILVAELVDNDCWENLSDLATALGEDELAEKFQAALDEEREHLRRVRSWIGAALNQSASGKLGQAVGARADERERSIAARAEKKTPVKAKRSGVGSAKPKRVSASSRSKPTKKGAKPGPRRAQSR